jgi:hypothetical protein
LEITCAEFIHIMKSYQEFSGEDFELNDSELEMLFWLCTPNFYSEPLTAWSSRMQLSQLCLAFMWLGPASTQNYIQPANSSVRNIYKWIHANSER